MDFSYCAVMFYNEEECTMSKNFSTSKKPQLRIKSENSGDRYLWRWVNL